MGSRISRGQRVAAPIEVHPPGARVRLSDGTTGTILLVELARERPYTVERERLVKEGDKEFLVKEPVSLKDEDFVVTAHPASTLQVFGPPQSGSPVPESSEGPPPPQPVGKQPSGIGVGLGGLARNMGVAQGDFNRGNLLLGGVLLAAGAYYFTRR